VREPVSGDRNLCPLDPKKPRVDGVGTWENWQPRKGADTIKQIPRLSIAEGEMGTLALWDCLQILSLFALARQIGPPDWRLQDPAHQERLASFLHEFLAGPTEEQQAFQVCIDRLCPCFAPRCDPVYPRTGKDLQTWLAAWSVPGQKRVLELMYAGPFQDGTIVTAFALNGLRVLRQQKKEPDLTALAGWLRWLDEQREECPAIRLLIAEELAAGVLSPRQMEEVTNRMPGCPPKNLSAPPADPPSQTAELEVARHLYRHRERFTSIHDLYKGLIALHWRQESSRQAMLAEAWNRPSLCDGMLRMVEETAAAAEEAGEEAGLPHQVLGAWQYLQGDAQVVATLNRWIPGERIRRNHFPFKERDNPSPLAEEATAPLVWMSRDDRAWVRERIRALLGTGQAANAAQLDVLLISLFGPEEGLWPARRHAQRLHQLVANLRQATLELRADLIADAPMEAAVLLEGLAGRLGQLAAFYQQYRGDEEPLSAEGGASWEEMIQSLHTLASQVPALQPLLQRADRAEVRWAIQLATDPFYRQTDACAIHRHVCASQDTVRQYHSRRLQQERTLFENKANQALGNLATSLMRFRQARETCTNPAPVYLALETLIDTQLAELTALGTQDYHPNRHELARPVQGRLRSVRELWIRLQPLLQTLSELPLEQQANLGEGAAALAQACCKTTHQVVDLLIGFNARGQHGGLLLLLPWHANDRDWLEDTLSGVD
jgi:hypothetical protein